MAFKKDEVYEEAKRIIKDKQPIFVEELVSFLACGKSTFYVMFPDGSDELDDIKDLINNNKIETKSSMRQKWYRSDNPTLQIGLMKLIGNEEERKRLNQSYQDITTKGESIKPLAECTEEELNERARLLAAKVDESN